MASKYIDLFPIPTGFPEILHDFAKELIRVQPKDIYDFGIEYFKSQENKTLLNYPIEDETDKSKDKKKMVIVDNQRQLDHMDQGRFNKSMDKYEQIKQFEENQNILAEQRHAQKLAQEQSHQTSRNVSGFVGEVIMNSSGRLEKEIREKQMKDRENEFLGNDNFEEYVNEGARYENEEEQEQRNEEENDRQEREDNEKKGLSHQSSNYRKAENFIDDVIQKSIENAEAEEKEKEEGN